MKAQISADLRQLRAERREKGGVDPRAEQEELILREGGIPHVIGDPWWSHPGEPLVNWENEDGPFFYSWSTYEIKITIEDGPLL